MSEYYSFRVFIEQFPDVIENNAVFTISEKISELFQCSYDRLGYEMLHPDYDFKEIGTMFPYNALAQEKFLELNIPTIFYGKEDEAAAPHITFELIPKNSASLSEFSVVFRYPVLKTSPLIITIDVNAELLSKPVDISQYTNIMSSLQNSGYQINSAFVHQYSGNLKRIILDGGQPGFCMPNEIRLASKAVKHQGANYKNKLMDVFSINSISNKAISSAAMTDICEIVGESNVSFCNSVFTFALPQSKMCKTKLRKLLGAENLIV